jgi:predicted DNA-binding helix-hairpin-helix protein
MRTRKASFATGQSTQVIVGADGSTDQTFLRRADDLYGSYRLRRVYYSAFSPIPEPSRILPLKAPPLMREHRLYQADWLMRFYGFDAREIVSDAAPNLDLDIDPKLAWALRNRDVFPIDINRAERRMLYRVPGLGVRNADRIIGIRQFAKVGLADLVRLRVSVKKVLPFIIAADHHPAKLEVDSARLRARFAPKPEQLEFQLRTPRAGEEVPDYNGSPLGRVMS